MTRLSLRVLSRMMIEGMSGRMNRSMSSSACLVMQMELCFNKKVKNMKKFKKFIEISYENIKDVLHVPIVE